MSTTTRHVFSHATIAILAAVATMAGAALLEKKPEAPKKQDNIGEQIHSYLLSNPKILLEVQDELQKLQLVEKRKEVLSTLTAAGESFTNGQHDVTIGNPDGDVTVVEFYDYNCAYCKKAMADMDLLLVDDKNLKFVLKEFPVIHPKSLEAHRVSMAFTQLYPKQAATFHRMVLNYKGLADAAVALDVAQELGGDTDALTILMNAPEIEATIKANYEIADKLNITGTPSYIIGDETVFGALGADVLRKKIENMRTCGSATCL